MLNVPINLNLNAYIDAGIAFLAIVAALFLYYRKRTMGKSEFDGNFDPAHVNARPVSSGGIPVAGGTLPRITLDDEEDDGMGGRLPHSSVGGGIITPFTYTSPAQHQNYDEFGRSQNYPIAGSPPPMSQYSADGHPPTIATTSSGSYYGAIPQQIAPSSGYLPTSGSTPTRTNSGSSGNNSLHNSLNNPRSAKEREALDNRNSLNGRGLSVANPSYEPEPEGTLAGGYDGQARQAYLQMGPQGRRPSQPDSPTYGFSTQNSPPPHPAPLRASGSASPDSRARSGVIVHQDGGRLQPDTAEGEERQAEIPPTYDSIPAEDRR